MADKEQIIIDGKKYNKCEGCELYDGYMCNGARSYEPEGEAHRAICDKHIAQEFWKVYNQLARKTQECEELKRKVELMMDCPDCKVDEYKKALEEIKEIVSSTLDCGEWVGQGDDKMAKILDIINKAKGEGKCNMKI